MLQCRCLCQYLKFIEFMMLLKIINHSTLTSTYNHHVASCRLFACIPSVHHRWLSRTDSLHKVFYKLLHCADNHVGWFPSMLLPLTPRDRLLNDKNVKHLVSKHWLFNISPGPGRGIEDSLNLFASSYVIPSKMWDWGPADTLSARRLSLIWTNQIVIYW